MRKSVKRAVVAGAVFAVTAGAGTAALAAWNVQGAGTSYAKAGTAVELKTVETVVDASLYPGVTGNAKIRVQNDNKFPVKITKIVWNPADGVAATPLPGRNCNNTGVYFGDFSAKTIGSNGVLGVAGSNMIVDKDGSASFTLSKAVRMINNSEDGCQGATFRIPVKVYGESAAN